jgi:hypothetical protein
MTTDLLPVSHVGVVTQDSPANGHLLQTGHAAHEAHTGDAGLHLLDPHCSSATQRISGVHLLPDDHRCSESHQPSVVGHTSPPTSTNTVSAPVVLPSGWVELRICADLFARAQAERIAVANMLRHTDSDAFGHHLEALERTEHAAKLMLRRCYRRVVPAELRELQKNTPGLGEDSYARILGHLGDPYIATPHWWEGAGTNRVLMQGDPYVRTISQLWAYCGHGDPARKKRKGMTAEEAFAMGNPSLKMLVHLQAEWGMRQKDGTPLRDAYTSARDKAEDKVHTVECVRCGPSGKPAQPGTPWSKAHQHAHALRIVGKEILRAMWLARHEVESSK